MKARSLLAVAVAWGLTLLALPAAATEAPSNGRDVVLAGVYSDQWNAGADVTALGQASGKRVSLVGTFHHLWESEHGVESNTDWLLEQAWSAQATPVANVEVAISAYDMAAGGYDAAIRQWALRVKGWLDRGEGRSLLIAPLQEMNGNWVAYGQDPGNFHITFHKFVDIFRSEGMDETKVRWVFAPNSWSVGRHSMAEYYPGGDLVDLVGISVYNFGAQAGVWTGVFESGMAAIDSVRSFAPTKPYLITQVGSSTAGGDRDAWLRELFAVAVTDPNVVGLIYFNFIKETDWKVWDGSAPAQGWTDGMQMPGTEYRWPLTTWFQAGPLPFSPYQGRFIDDDTTGNQGDIEWLARLGVVAGCTADQFCPSNWVTRGELASFLVRTLGLKTTSADFFIDDDGSAHEGAINSLAQAGITTGCLPDRFCPDNLVSRGQLAFFLASALELPAQATIQFVDTHDSKYLAEINSIVAAGIGTGCAADQFCPLDAVSRGQIASFLRRGIEAVFRPDCRCSPWPNSEPSLN
ncbi:hypothetical protein BH18ACT5_BH18ACT5_11410 [soil metagenome]